MPPTGSPRSATWYPWTTTRPTLGISRCGFRAGANAHELLQSRLDSPGCVRIGRFNRLAPRPIDFVLVWRRDLAPADHCTRGTLRAVDQAYRRVQVSPRGYAELLERRVD